MGTPLWTVGAVALALVAPVPAIAAPSTPRDFVVYGFSQSDVGDEDPQVYTLKPDVTIRAIGKWSTAGDEAADYNFAQIPRYHAQGTTFMGSGTASVIFPRDFATEAIYDDMSTRDAENVPVPHDEFGFGEPVRRGNLFNPAYREHLLAWARIQIDGGVDGINLDEVNGGFSGGQKYGFNGNEGFDDYTLADFNRYLLAKYPAFTPADWQARFGMTGPNVPRPDVPFDYRAYLRAGGWQTDPLNAANPLAAEWGRVVPNRLYAGDTTFTGTYVRRYWKELVDRLRGYAASRGRRLLISSNGLWPYVDFNSVGMYPWNPDEQTPDWKGADYVPVRDGHLNGAKSLGPNYRYLKERSREIAGDVPVAVFIDWPNEMMTNYLNLPPGEQRDYWRIFGAEAYANGLFPAFHLKDTVGSPTAQEQGMLGFLTRYSGFYRAHADLFRGNSHAPQAVRVDTPKIAATLLHNRHGRTIHLVNHRYAGAPVPWSNVVVSAALPSCPRAVRVFSPDGPRRATTTCRNGRLTVTVDRLEAYDVIALR
ncbi:hypothetical protein Val02_36270 [Virgisporangium aliadipatigenens]|uniref:Uncharacterized protein n=1 Tax=Virgisporangium aliadipatigenens TaxID=741659 RepID=A0A8J3YKA4_9ACTN|nr:hypothetical protein [Virgisporangium aliadipatigenens]GIJ46741.1 hypothetical protein Val02_36270 [Virgisporangium aliadipatigenens]